MSLLQIFEPTTHKEEQEEQEIIIGIDLGTTNSGVGTFIEGELVLFKDENGKNLIPSIVNFQNGEKEIRISSIKRLMGKAVLDVNKDEFDFEIIDEKGELKVKIAEEKYRPEEISAKILKKLKNIAESHLKKEVKKAVITVPAYFDEAAKNATKLAAELSGLEVARLLNEPTAAALAYGLENSSEGTYLVYDLGGGTFDISLLKMQKGVFKVLGVSGNNHLGGDDFDLAIAKELSISKFEAKKIKEEICSQNINKSLSLTKFEELISAKIGETISLTQNLLEDLDIDEDDVKGIILVGGSSRIPLIRKKLMEIFSSEKILTNLDPDRVVAIGAAHQANSLMGNSDNLLLDVNALSLGIEMMGGIVEKIIQRNSTIPTAYAKEFTTYADNQTGMKFHIVQGERELAKNCRSLANFEIKGIPAMKAGIAKILVTFKLDADGLLTVSAEEKTTKIKQEIEVKPTFSLDENQVKEMLLDSLKNSKDDIQERLLIEAATEANQDLVIIENDIKNGLVEKEEKEKILEKLEKLRLAITQKNSREEIIQAQEELGKISENLVLSKVNEALSKKIAGKNIDEV